MRIGKVIGNIWATKKEEKLAGIKLLIVQPINIVDETNTGTPIVAADMIGAGCGEIVILVDGSSARKAVGGLDVPVDSTVVGIVDGNDISTELL